MKSLTQQTQQRSDVDGEFCDSDDEIDVFHFEDSVCCDKADLPSEQNPIPPVGFQESSERRSLIHCARVYIAESRRRGSQPFAFTLLAWAANCRKKVGAKAAPAQGDLFAGLCIGSGQ